MTGGGGDSSENNETMLEVSEILLQRSGEKLTLEVMDFSLFSPNLLLKFIYYLHECKLVHCGCLGYTDAIFELIDFKKISGASDAVLQKLSESELYCACKELVRQRQR